MDSLWVARDSKGNLSLFNKKPIKKEYVFNGELITYFVSSEDEEFKEMDLNKEWFKDVTFENSPVACIIGYFNELYDIDSLDSYLEPPYKYKIVEDFEVGKTYIFEREGKFFLDKCIANQRDFPAIFENNTTPGIGCYTIGEYVPD
jgi:hypothetical protein